MQLLLSRGHMRNWDCCGGLHQLTTGTVAEGNSFGFSYDASELGP